MLSHLHGLRLHDNSHQADPHAGQKPHPRLLLSEEAGRITGPENHSGASEWAKPIAGAALKVLFTPD